MTMPTTRPSIAFDARGQAIALPAEEERQRQADALRALDELNEMGDEVEQAATFAALVAGIDESRTSDRRRFRP